MHAPATPGDSVPGDAAGDDSGQGSEPEQPEANPPSDELRITSAKLGDLELTEYEDKPLLVSAGNRFNQTIVFTGENLDKIESLIIYTCKYMDYSNLMEVPAHFQRTNADGQAVWEFNNSQSQIEYAIAAIRLNGERVFENEIGKQFSDSDLDSAAAVYD